MKGWFDAFRDDGAPTLYSFSNRTPVIGDVSIIVVSILFATFYTAFLVIFPGVRKQKFSTFITVTLSLFVGLVIFGKYEINNFFVLIKLLVVMLMNKKQAYKVIVILY